MYVSTSRRVLAAGCFLTIGCNGFKVADYPDERDLYRESLRRLEAGDGRSAITGFERLTLELPARDTLLPRSHYYLGKAHAEEKEWLLAAQAYSRLSSLFPDDTLADDGLLAAANAYSTLWPDPELDPTYGHSAIAMYRSLIESYPSSPLVAEAQRGITAVEARLAEKDYRNAEYYRPRTAHSAIMYYKEIIANYPNAPRVPDAYAKMATVYKSINYTEDYEETCNAARERFAGHPAVREACAAAPVAAPATPPPALTSPPPAAGSSSPPPSRAPPPAASRSSASAR